MSGIVGILYRDGRSVAGEDLEHMLDSLWWRGPDGRRSWREGTIGLGHLLLRVTPESGYERQPLVRGQLAITADVRLDNRQELIAALDLSGPADEITDPEIILRAYQQWGERCVDHLLGDFAFALWDGRERRLLCARDHLGVRPFVYYCPDGAFVFGSQAAAILAVPGVPRRLNDEFIARFIAGTLDDPAIMAYHGLLRLPAAHALAVGPEGVRLWRYWSLDAGREVRLGSDSEYEDAFRAIFSAAVECRLRTSAPVGSALSGGLDSSSIACTARRLLPPDRPLHTFSLVFPGHPEVDERKYIEAVHQLGGFTSHLINGDTVSPFIDLEWQLEAQSEPSLAPNLFLHWAMYRAARQAGVCVFLDGFDGDAAVGHGAQRMNQLLWQGRWLTYWREARALGGRYGAEAWRRPLRTERHALALELRAMAPAPLFHLYRRIRPTLPVAPRSFALRQDLMARAQTAPSTRNGPVRSERLSHYNFVSHPLIPFALEITNRAAAAHGLESCHPYFDRRLVEFCLALPADQKLRDGWTRSILRRSMEGILPVTVQWRPEKSNLGPILPDVLLRFERNRVERSIRSGTLDPFVDRAALEVIWDRYCREPAPLDSVILWRWASVALWLQREESGARLLQSVENAEA
jgi:asparagine synthase (glutamine-hydrolysing)